MSGPILIRHSTGHWIAECLCRYGWSTCEQVALDTAIDAPRVERAIRGMVKDGLVQKRRRHIRNDTRYCLAAKGVQALRELRS